ncbi:MAG: protein arginine kinase [Planctomycetota bacterium]|nr:protein arginine kinase [Planctomycetota bacterium]
MSSDRLEPYVGEWLAGEGVDSDLVISSRVRLARNLPGIPFSTLADDSHRAQVADLIGNALDGLRPGLNLTCKNLDEMDPIDRQVLLERHLVSRELASGTGPRLVAFDESEAISLMGNEEDHLRIQVVKSGYRLEEAWEQMDQLERTLDGQLQFAFDQQYGYLTACPTNTGTGMRVSVMLHLPALVITGQIEEVTRAATKIHLAVRGLFGEGTEAQGDFFQISNQRTLGLSEEEILSGIASVLPNILSYERKLRKELIERKREWIEDRIGRSFGTLSHAKVITSQEGLEHLSMVRLGVCMGILENLSLEQVNRMFLFSQPGHLQANEGKKMSSDERDWKRAAVLASILQEN